MYYNKKPLDFAVKRKLLNSKFIELLWRDKSIKKEAGKK